MEKYKMVLILHSLYIMSPCHADPIPIAEPDPMNVDIGININVGKVKNEVPISEATAIEAPTTHNNITEMCAALRPPGFVLPLGHYWPCAVFGAVYKMSGPGGTCCQDACITLTPPPSGFWINSSGDSPTCNDYGVFPTDISKLKPIEEECCQASTDTCPSSNFTKNHVCTGCTTDEDAKNFTRNVMGPSISGFVIVFDGHDISYNNSAVDHGSIPYEKSCLINNPVNTWNCTWIRIAIECDYLGNCTAQSGLVDGVIVPESINCTL